MQTIRISQENEFGLEAEVIHHSQDTKMNSFMQAVAQVEGFDLTDLLKAINGLGCELLLNANHPSSELRGTKATSARFGTICVSFNPHFGGR